MRHSKSTKVTKEEYYVIKTSLDHGTTTQAKIGHDFRRSPYTLKRIKDSKSYNDYLMMVGRQEVDVEEYRQDITADIKIRPIFNTSVNGYDDEDVEWEVINKEMRIADTHRMVKEILKRLDQIDENTKYIR